MDAFLEIIGFLADMVFWTSKGEDRKGWRIFVVIVTLAAIALGALFALMQLGYL